MDKPTKPTLWKTSLAVWAPILILGAIYSVAYGVRYHQAKNLESQYQSNLSKCQAEIPGQIAKNENSGLRYPVVNVNVCYDVETKIGHGTLGLPVFLENGSPVSKP